MRFVGEMVGVEESAQGSPAGVSSQGPFCPHPINDGEELLLRENGFTEELIVSRHALL